MTNNRGFTLIEIAVSMVLISVSIIGLNAAFSTISATTRDLTLRQKAIIAVNNEMERLYGIYDQNPGDLAGQLGAMLVCPLPSTSTDPPYTAEITDFMVRNIITDIAAPVGITGTDIDGVFVFNDAGTQYNVVPIDFEHDITGQLELCRNFANPDYYDLTLILRYPYRFRSDANPIDPTDPTLFKVDTVRVTTSLAK